MTRQAAGFTFSRAARLAGRHAFASVFAYKCSVTGKFFQVYARPSERAQPRLGITVNKRFVPQATARKFCKRLARETFRLHRLELNGVDLVVRARSTVLSTASEQARAEILDLMERARRLCCGGASSAQQR